jgi:HK97 gp10 family phage protein
MASGKSIQIHGLDEIEKRLKALPEKLRKRSIKRAFQDGLDILADEIRLRVPRRLSAGWEAFVDRGTSLADAVASALTVGAQKTAGKVGLDYTKTRHGHLLEFGTKPHKIGKRQHPGSKARPFMRPSFDSRGDAAVDEITTQLAKAVEKEV